MSSCLRGLLCGVLLFAQSAEAGQAITLRATAGLGGLVKPGRTVPVRVELDSSQADPTPAALTVSWGDTSQRRTVSLASPGIRQFDFYLRTSEAEGLIRVRWEGAGGSTIEVPVTVLGYDDEVTVCVATPEAVVPEPGRCSAVVPPDSVPPSIRGLEAADHVVVAGDGRALTAAQRSAIERWRSLRRLDVQGDLALTPQATRPLLRRGLPPSTAGAVAGASLAYIAALLLAGLTITRRLPRLMHAWLALAAIAAVATLATRAIGRIGDAGVRVHHSSLLQQIPGTGASVLTLRGVAEFSSHDRFRVQLPIADGVVEATAAEGRGVQIIDEGGYAVLEGAFGMGARQSFVADAIVEAAPLAVDIDGDAVRVSNQTDAVLHDCRFGEALSGGEIGSLSPGASASARLTRDAAGPVITCRMDAAAVTFTDARHGVEMTGVTVIAAYRHRPADRTVAGLPDD